MGYYDDGNGAGWDYTHNRSCNAVNAEIDGKLPISKFRQMSHKELVEHICQHDNVMDIDDWDKLDEVSKKDLLSCLVTNEWHHVGLFHQPVDYYEFDAAKFLAMVQEKDDGPHPTEVRA